MRYIIGALIAVGLFIVILVLIFTGGPSQPNGRQPINPVSLANTDSDVQLVVEGELSADSTRREIEITIGRDSSQLEIIGGYNGNVISSHQIGNNQAAYDTFLHGLALAGFSDGDLSASQDERGHCALGERYLYQVVSATGQVKQKLWNDSCGVGTFKGEGPLIRQLFQLQLPDYANWTSGVNLSV